YAHQPRVDVLAGQATSAWDPATGTLTLNYVHNGLTRVRITAGGRSPLTLLLADDATADTFWRQDTAAGPVLVRGPSLVRTAASHGLTLRLPGDPAPASDLEVWGPGLLTFFNDRLMPTVPTTSGSRVAVRPPPGPNAVPLPQITGWRSAPGSPES